ncbi:hypothetical protein B0H13DRAFT_2345427 [Mycena leptocephala]|nr:hypothetical protein B0H13DRAFT_2345427 [Mycena leptocephala]
MSDSHLEWIWSRYVTSPKPLSHMQSLQRTCIMFTEHFLEPSHIVLAGGGFVLHPDLAELLSDVVHSMEHLLRLASQYHGVNGTPFIGSAELCILTTTTSLHIPATQNQVVMAWVLLLDHLSVAIRELRGLCLSNPFDPLRREWPLRIPEAIMMLPPSLCIKLPIAFVESFGMLMLLRHCRPKVNVPLEQSQRPHTQLATRFCVEHTDSGRPVFVEVLPWTDMAVAAAEKDITELAESPCTQKGSLLTSLSASSLKDRALGHIPSLGSSRRATIPSFPPMPRDTCARTSGTDSGQVRQFVQHFEAMEIGSATHFGSTAGYQLKDVTNQSARTCVPPHVQIDAHCRNLEAQAPDLIVEPSAKAGGLEVKLQRIDKFSAKDPDVKLLTLEGIPRVSKTTFTPVFPPGLVCWGNMTSRSAKTRCEPLQTAGQASARPAVGIVALSPSPKSHAPTLAIASAVELGGLHRQVVEGIARSRSSALPPRDCPEAALVEKAARRAHPHMKNTNVEPGGLDDPAHLNQQGDRALSAERRTMDKSARASGRSPEAACVLLLHLAHSSCTPPSLPLALGLVISSARLFALISAIIRTWQIYYLVWILREVPTPLATWAREGIGTSR